MRSFSEYSYQIATVAVGWQIYELTGSALDLGLVGLVQFIPSALLVFAAGHAADRYDRRRVAQICQIVEGLVSALLAWGTFAGWLTVPEIFAALTLFGVTAAFEIPAGTALLPGVAPQGIAATGHRAFLRRVPDRGDRRAGAGRGRLRNCARRALCADGDILTYGGNAERTDQAGRPVTARSRRPLPPVRRRRLRTP